MSGNDGPTIRAAMKLAKTSFIQTSSNQRMVTRSPNHIWAVSWAMTLARPSSWFRLAVGSRNSDSARYQTAPGCSIPPNWNDGTARNANFSNGYGIPV